MRDSLPFIALLAVLVAGAFFFMRGGNSADGLIGLPAPSIQIELLDGGTMTLADHLGKDVVMLDFWATWCPPCVASMPIIEKAAKEFADRNVVLYAINQAEDPQTVSAFLAEHNLTPTVAMDYAYQAAREYRVEGIPQLVLIDKQGVVQAVHVGAYPGLESTLRWQLDTLAQGKSLVKPKT